ncbi:unnamed protein product [Cuscuta campestris]|uniref:Uncharacterized protein n=1 Tax=Cuscuta campestris TaxID=132261 RepID=A0A484MRD9_9ASTE|nr:unnamed protein product [Cuscuta campestris]
MKSKRHPPFSTVGQRSIPSAFLSTSSIRSGKDAEIKDPGEKKRPNISLSDYLNKKLHRSSVSPLPDSVKTKDEQFKSPDEVHSGKEKGNERENDMDEHCLVDAMFEKLKQWGKTSDGAGEGVIPSCTETSNKRGRNVFEGDDDCKQNSAGKKLVVLGEGSKSKQKRIGDSKAKKSATYFNHYASGGGWWDSEKEGVDNEEVGCNGTWEVYHIPH